MADFEIRIGVIGNNHELKFTNTAGSLINRLIKEAITEDSSMDATAVSPLTGEPIHLSDDETTALEQIDKVTVSSRSTVYNLIDGRLKEIRHLTHPHEESEPNVVIYHDGSEE